MQLHLSQFYFLYKMKREINKVMQVRIYNIVWNIKSLPYFLDISYDSYISESHTPCEKVMTTNRKKVSINSFNINGSSSFYLLSILATLILQEWPSISFSPCLLHSAVAQWGLNLNWVFKFIIKQYIVIGLGQFLFDNNTWLIILFMIHCINTKFFFFRTQGWKNHLKYGLADLQTIVLTRSSRSRIILDFWY